MDFPLCVHAENMSLFHWVRRELHACFDFIIHEPPPHEMLTLIDGLEQTHGVQNVL